ncbi:hypothetical protein GCM10010430_45750 [Kitasatospora cystarginea]|uniref:Uncharacterized protein n=1 Tax=Kitasatospora cystarginea TaxID=58350 RepID=A0ABN3EFA4_9ACTN
MLLEEGPLALEADQPALVDQHVDREADGVAGHAVLLLQLSLDRERDVARPLPGRDAAAQIGGQALVLR